jgi:hypothetical protein
MKVETTRLATIEKAITAMPMPRLSTSVLWTRCRTASKAITPEPTRISMPSIAAARFSTFSCP